MKISSLSALLVMSALIISGVASARGIRSDNPGFTCDLQKWTGLYEDPYMPLDGNSNGSGNLSTFFVPGTVTTGDTVHYCSPRPALAKIWSTIDPGGQLPNPASKPDPVTGAPTDKALEARGAVMFEWANNGASPPLDFLAAPDVEVIVWTLPASTKLPGGAFEIELDNWCGLSPFFTSGSQTAPNASSSFTWNGHGYTADCAGFNGGGTSATDLLINGSGVLIGYVDANDDTQITSTVPGWSVSAL